PGQLDPSGRAQQHRARSQDLVDVLLVDLAGRAGRLAARRRPGSGAESRGGPEPPAAPGASELALRRRARETGRPLPALEAGPGEPVLAQSTLVGAVSVGSCGRGRARRTPIRPHDPTLIHYEGAR